MRKLCVASLLLVLPLAACGSENSDSADSANPTQASGATDDLEQSTEGDTSSGGSQGQSTGTSAPGSASGASESASTTMPAGETGGETTDPTTDPTTTPSTGPTTGDQESSTGEVPTSGPGVLPGETGFDSMCRRAMECGSTYYSDAQACMDAGIDYWGTCAEVIVALDNFGACMSEMACEDYDPDAYNPNSTPCADLYGDLQDAGPC